MGGKQAQKLWGLGGDMNVVWDLQNQNPGVIMILFYLNPQNSGMDVDKYIRVLPQFYFNINMKGESPLSKWGGSGNFVFVVLVIISS